MTGLSLVLLLGGCADVAGSDPAVLAATPSYEADIKPILDDFCVRCHTHAGRLDGGVGLATYASARAARVKTTCASVGLEVAQTWGEHLLPAAGHGSDVPCEPWALLSMPPGAQPLLSLEQQVLMARWVATGAQP